MRVRVAQEAKRVAKAKGVKAPVGGVVIMVAFSYLLNFLSNYITSGCMALATGLQGMAWWASG